MFSQRDWDVAELESKLRIQKLFQEWVGLLMRGRNPIDQLQQMTPQQAVDLQNAPPVQLPPKPPEGQ